MNLLASRAFLQSWPPLNVLHRAWLLLPRAAPAHTNTHARGSGGGRPGARKDEMADAADKVQRTRLTQALLDAVWGGKFRCGA